MRTARKKRSSASWVYFFANAKMTAAEYLQSNDEDAPQVPHDAVRSY